MVSDQGGKTADRKGPTEDNERNVEIHLSGGGKGGGRVIEMEEYFRRCQNTVSQYIATQSLLDLCEESERDPGAQVGMLW